MNPLFEPAESQPVESIDYAKPTTRSVRLFSLSPERKRLLVTCSFINAGIAIVLLSCMLWQFTDQLSQNALARASDAIDGNRNFRYGMEDDFDHLGLTVLLSVLLVDMGLQIVLIAGSELVRRSKRSGIILHWLYLPLHLLISVVLLLVVVAESQTQLRFVSEAVPAIIICIYPLCIAVILTSKPKRYAV